MVGYRNDQFKVTPGLFSGAAAASGERANPPFNYTASEVRTYNAGINDTGFGQDSTITVQLRRGFMKNLSTKLGKVGTQKAPEALKLRFQFNPSTIQQQVEARQDMYLSVLQDPYQLTQPVAGSTSFSFELLFDRTHEVMNGGPEADLVNNPGQPLNDLSSGEAGDIGVLADLEVLYSIIGQGFSKGTIEGQYNVLKENARREYDRAVASGDPLFTWAEQVTEGNNSRTIYKEKSTFDKYFQDEFLKRTEFLGKDGGVDTSAANINIGNAAFLVPMPVRIIFSALYMVDGYVMSTNVIFTKFNTNMVPIQCRVLLNVQAVYLGFARDKTFISEQIAKSGEDAREELESAEKVFNDFCKGYGDKLSKYLVTLGGGARFMDTRYALGPAGGVLSANPIAASYATVGSEVYKPLGLNVGKTDEDLEPLITSGFSKPASGADKLEEYWDDGKLITISHTSTVSVYGPYASRAEADKASRSSSKLVGQFTQSKASSSTQEWLKPSADDVGTANLGMFSVHNWNNNLNTATNGLSSSNFSDQIDNYKNGYFAFYIDVEVTASTPEGLAKDTKKATQKQVYKGTDEVGSRPFTFDLPKCTEQKNSKKDDNPYASYLNK